MRLQNLAYASSSLPQLSFRVAGFARMRSCQQSLNSGGSSYSSLPENQVGMEYQWFVKPKVQVKNVNRLGASPMALTLD